MTGPQFYDELPYDVLLPSYAEHLLLALHMERFRFPGTFTSIVQVCDAYSKTETSKAKLRMHESVFISSDRCGGTSLMLLG